MYRQLTIVVNNSVRLGGRFASDVPKDTNFILTDANNKFSIIVAVIITLLSYFHLVEMQGRTPRPVVVHARSPPALRACGAVT